MLSGLMTSAAEAPGIERNGDKMPCLKGSGEG